MTAKKHRYMSAQDRFWMSVEKTDTCWLWTACTDKSGYGRIRGEYGYMRAHRYSYALHFGPISGGLWVLHKCDNPRCVRPDHLFLGTAKENSEDRDKKGRTAKGKRNGHFTRPECTPHGARHYNYHNTEAPQRGAGNGRAKLTEEDVQRIRELWNTGKYTKCGLGRMFSVTDVLVFKIVTRALWTHVE